MTPCTLVPTSSPTAPTTAPAVTTAPTRRCPRCGRDTPLAVWPTYRATRADGRRVMRRESACRPCRRAQRTAARRAPMGAPPEPPRGLAGDDTPWARAAAALLPGVPEATWTRAQRVAVQRHAVVLARAAALPGFRLADPAHGPVRARQRPAALAQDPAAVTWRRAA